MFSLARAHQELAEDRTIENGTLHELAGTLACFVDLVEAAKHYPALKKQRVEFLCEQPDAATDRVEVSDTRAA